MPVDAGDADGAGGVPHARERTGDQRAAPAEHERPLAGGHHLADRLAHDPGHGQNVGRADDAGLRVSLLPADAHVEVASIGDREALDEPRLSQGSGRVLGHRHGRRIDRYPDGDPAHFSENAKTGTA